MPQGEVVIDPFTGQSMSRDALDALLVPYRRRRAWSGDFDAPLGLFLQAAPPREVIARMLRNLKEIHPQRRGLAAPAGRAAAAGDPAARRLGGAARPRPGACRARRAHAGDGRPGRLPRARARRRRSPRHRASASPSSATATASPACIERRRARSDRDAPHARAAARSSHWAALGARRAALVVWLLGPVLTPFAIGAVLAYALHPLVEKLAARRRAAAARGGAGRDRRADRRRARWCCWSCRSSRRSCRCCASSCRCWSSGSTARSRPG